ncbi:MAG: GntR family transcriptional regulator [Sedimentisphaeraceae bacterium JB056]
MTLWIQIASGSKEPIYKQVVDQITEAIARGQLSPGDKLPAVRNLAAELVVNPNTIARSYTILEQNGLVATKTGSGTFVTDPKSRNYDTAQLNIINERMDNIISQLINSGLNEEQILELFKTRLNKFGETKNG